MFNIVFVKKVEGKNQQLESLTRKHENEVAGIVGILVYISDTKFC